VSTRVKLLILALRACLSAAIANVRQQSFDLDLAQTWIEPDAPPLVVE
jgi:hypothetical protein